jgi:hypothetical protein
MEFITKTELCTKLGLGVTSTETLLRDIDENPITIGKRFYYNYSSILTKIKDINKAKVQKTSQVKEEYEINNLKKEIQKKIDRNEIKLKGLKSDLDGIEKSMETYIIPRRNRIQQVIEEFSTKKISQNAYVNFSEMVFDTSLFGAVLRIFDEHIEDGDYDKKVDFVYNGKSLSVIIIVRDGILARIKKVKNFAN